MVNVYFWRGQPYDAPFPIQENWGDRLAGFLLFSLGVDFQWSPPEKADLVCIGSVLEHLPDKWAGTVVGAGKLFPDSTVDLSHAKVAALRGKLTQAGVTGVPPNVVLGDTGLLVPRWLRRSPAQYDLGILPHWSDKQLWQRFKHGHLIDPTAPPWQVIQEIGRCRRLITSSLHGMVVADAYGIPRRAELFPGAHNEGGDFKHRDYCSIYDTHPHFGEFWTAPHDVVQRTQDRLYDAFALALDHEPLPDFVPDPKIEISRNKRCPQISLLVPFRDDGEHRTKVWEWLRKYWLDNLDSVEIIQGHDGGWPFSKSRAINHAARRARGRVFAVLDADTYLDAHVIQRCADNIERAVKHRRHLWYVPYDKLYRINHRATMGLLELNPHLPYSVSSPPPTSWLEDGPGPYGVDPSGGRARDHGHEYGALIQIMPREAFFAIGGWESRIAGWGSEDVSALMALDTLYGQHEVTHNDVLHLWHARMGTNWETRKWVGQTHTPANSRLAQRYQAASGEPGYMAQLVREHPHPEPTFCTKVAIAKCRICHTIGLCRH